MAPGVATPLAAALITIFGGFGFWQQKGISEPDLDNAAASAVSILLPSEEQSEMSVAGSQAVVGETFVAQGAPEDDSSVEFKFDLDVREFGKVEPTEPDLVEQPAPAVASAPVLAPPDASETFEQMTASFQETSLPNASAEPAPESPLFGLGVALAFGLAGLLHWRLARSVHYQRRRGEDAPTEVEEQQGAQIFGDEAPTCSFESDQSAFDGICGMPEGPDLLIEGEVNAVKDDTSSELIAETEDESLATSLALAADVLNDGVVESVAALSLLFPEALPAVGDDVAAQRVQVLGDFRSLVPAAWAVVHSEFMTTPAATTIKVGPFAADSAILNQASFFADFRSLSSVAWAEIHKPFHASVGDPGVDGAVASSQAAGNICPSTPAAEYLPVDAWDACPPAPVGTAKKAIELHLSQVPAEPDDALGAESVSSDDMFDEEVLERLSLVLDEEAGAAQAAHAEHATAAEWHGESDQHVTPPSTPRVVSPAPRMETAKMEEDEKGGLERALRGISSPNRRRPTASAENTRPAEL